MTHVMNEYLLITLKFTGGEFPEDPAIPLIGSESFTCFKVFGGNVMTGVSTAQTG